MPGENSKPTDWTTLKSVKIMSRNAWQASAGQAKKTEATKPAEGKPSEMKSGMGGNAGMDMKGTSPAPATSGTSSTESTGHPGHDTVESAKQATQPQTTPAPDQSGGTEESGK